MKKMSLLLLCYALIFVPFAASASPGVTGQVNIPPHPVHQAGVLPDMHPLTLPAVKSLPASTLHSSGNDIMQFKAGGHIIGFKPDKVYLVNTEGFLSVEFMGTKGVMPKSPSGKTRGKHQGLEQLDKVEYQDLWAGITLSYQGVGVGIAESIYRIKPGADAGDIKLKYSAETELQKDGSLRIKLPTDQGWMIESRPVAWQEIGGRKKPVEVAFRMEDKQLGFRVAEYDRDYDLIIDPTYEWHTFYGSAGGDNYGRGILVDDSGNVYVTGSSTGAWDGPGAAPPLSPFSGSSGYQNNLFVLKLSSGGAYQWHTFYGSAGGADLGEGIAVDGSGNVYVTGSSTASWDGPGATPPLNSYTGNYEKYDTFVLKLSSDGTYQWHTFYGSTAGDDYGYGISSDGNGNVYVTGSGTASWNGPGATAPLNAYSGSGGYEIFVLKLNGGGAYQWHTFFGTGWDSGKSITVDAMGNVFITGESQAAWNGPGATAPLNAYSGSGGYEIFVLRLNGSGAYQWHTFFGSAAGIDSGNGAAVDGSGNVYVTGQSNAAWNGPGATAPLNDYVGGGNSDTFVLKLGSSGAYQWHAFYGSAAGIDSGTGITVDSSGNVYMTGFSYAAWNGPGAAPPLKAYSSSVGGANLFVLKLSDPLPQAAVSISPPSQDFGSVIIGNSSPSQSFTVTNNGPAGYAVTSASITGADTSEFSIQNDMCSGKTLTPSGTCTVQVLFAPASNGARSASLSVLYDSVKTVAAALTGTGISGSHTLAVTKSNASTGAGRVTSSPSGIDCGFDCTSSFASGSLVILSAVPDADSTFAGWSGGGCSGAGACTITMNADATVTATFTAVANSAYEISPPNKTFKAGGGSLMVRVTAMGQNNYPAPLIGSHDYWITQSGAINWKKNKGTVKIVVQKNLLSQSRTGVIWIGGKVLTIEQSGTQCRLTALKPSSKKVTKESGAGSFNVVVSPQDCAWNLSTTSAWIHLDSLAGTGTGSAAFNIDANATGRNRTGKIGVSLAENAEKKKVFSLTQKK